MTDRVAHELATVARIVETTRRQLGHAPSHLFVAVTLAGRHPQTRALATHLDTCTEDTRAGR